MAEQKQAACGVVGTEQLLAALKFHFSYDAFRPNQQQAIEATLAGRDSLLIIPTGKCVPWCSGDGCFSRRCTQLVLATVLQQSPL